jgi:hypothetical protein
MSFLFELDKSIQYVIRMNPNQKQAYTDKIRMAKPPEKRRDKKRSDENRKFWACFILHYPYAYAVFGRCGAVTLIFSLLRNNTARELR